MPEPRTCALPQLANCYQTEPLTALRWTLHLSPSPKEEIGITLGLLDGQRG